MPITAAINGRGFSALRASETLQNLIQTSLPPNQWEIEVSSWFSTGLASLQNTVQDYVNPRNIVPGISVGEPQTTVDIAMCSNQKTEFTNGTISFSVLGIAVILVVGMLIVLTSFFLAPIVGYLGFKSYHSWVLDDTLQLQRMVFETRGVRWTGYDRGVPVTETPERFPAVASSAESQALMADHRDEKMVGTNVIQIREEVA